MTDNSPSAFPVMHTIDGNWNKEPLDVYMGMSLRDYFASASVTAWGAINVTDEDIAIRARIAYRIADAMIAERAK